MTMELETSSLSGRFVITRDKSGEEVEEPVISGRRLELKVALPLGQSVVIFDSEAAAGTKGLKPASLGGGGGSSDGGHAQTLPAAPGLKVRMQTTELK